MGVTKISAFGSSFQGHRLVFRTQPCRCTEEGGRLTKPGGMEHWAGNYSVTSGICIEAHAQGASRTGAQPVLPGTPSRQGAGTDPRARRSTCRQHPPMGDPDVPGSRGRTSRLPGLRAAAVTSPVRPEPAGFRKMHFTEGRGKAWKNQLYSDIFCYEVLKMNSACL